MCCLVQDKVQSIYQGRPARLREQDVNVPISFMDDYEELDQFTSLSYAREEILMSFPTRSLSVFEQLCKLSLIMDRILSEIYAENCSSKSASHQLNTARSLHQDLEHWRKSLPEHLNMNFDNSSHPPLTPHALSLMLVYFMISYMIFLLIVIQVHVSFPHYPSTSPIRIRRTHPRYLPSCDPRRIRHLCSRRFRNRRSIESLLAAFLYYYSPIFYVLCHICERNHPRTHCSAEWEGLGSI